MEIALGYELLASLHAAAQDSGNIRGNRESHLHNLLCRGYRTSARDECACGVPDLLTDLDAAVFAALVAEVTAVTGLSQEDLAPVLALDLDGLTLFRAGWRTAYPHLKVLTELRDLAEAMPAIAPARRREVLMAPVGAHPDTISALLAALAPEEAGAALGSCAGARGTVTEAA